MSNSTPKYCNWQRVIVFLILPPITLLFGICSFILRTLLLVIDVFFFVGGFLPTYLRVLQAKDFEAASVEWKAYLKRFSRS